MPCWPDLWERVRRLLPLLGILLTLFGYIAIVAILLWAPKLRKRWQRVASRIIGTAAALPLIWLLPAMLFGLMLASGNPPTQTRIVRSKSGLEASVSYDAGFLGRDYTQVTLKTPGCCRHVPVFSHAGPSWFDDVQVEWVDDRQLHLTYHTRPDDPQHCEQRAGEVTIVCNSVVWPQAAPATTKSDK